MYMNRYSGNNHSVARHDISKTCPFNIKRFFSAQKSKTIFFLFLLKTLIVVRYPQSMFPN